MFDACYSLKSVVLPQGGSSYMFRNCENLHYVHLGSATDLGASMFYYCYSLYTIVIPATVTRIFSRAFYKCTNMKVYDFRAATSVPTLSATDGISENASMLIVVPNALYDEWIEASNWATYESYIIKASLYEA